MQSGLGFYTGQYNNQALQNVHTEEKQDLGPVCTDMQTGSCKHME